MRAAILFGIIFWYVTALSVDNNTIYVVSKGDSFTGICQKFQISKDELLASNPGLNPARLAVGQRVKIPAKMDSTNRTGSASQTPTPKGEGRSEEGTTSSMYPVTLQDKKFLEQIKKAVLTNDVEWLSGVVSYPLGIKQNGKTITLNNSSDFKKYATTILTAHLKSAVQNQLPDSLFKNWQGVMIGNGAIWFSAIKETPDDDWRHRIIGINPEHRPIEKGKPTTPSQETSTQEPKRLK